MSPAHPLNIVVLLSGNGSNLQAIIDAIESEQLNIRIQAVISNRPEAFGLQRAQKHGIKTIALDHRQFNSREQFDAELCSVIDECATDLIVLAGYMRILTPVFIQHFAPYIINIHPSLLPKYQGLHTHQRALDNKDNKHGVSIHIVTPELDAGPVIMQGEFAIESSDDVDSLIKKGHALEYQMYPRVLKWLSEKRLLINAEGLPEFDHEQLHKPLLFKAV